MNQMGLNPLLALVTSVNYCIVSKVLLHREYNVNGTCDIIFIKIILNIFSFQISILFICQTVLMELQIRQRSDKIHGEYSKKPMNRVNKVLRTLAKSVLD